MKEVIDFFRRLHDNNDRAWFDVHRAEWTHVKGRFAAFTERLIEGIAEFDTAVRGLRVQDCPYRPLAQNEAVIIYGPCIFCFEVRYKTEW